MLDPDTWVINADDIEAFALRRLVAGCTTSMLSAGPTLRQFLDEETVGAQLGGPRPKSVRDRLRDLVVEPTTPSAEMRRGWTRAVRTAYPGDDTPPFRVRDHRRLSLTELVLDAFNQGCVTSTILAIGPSPAVYVVAFSGTACTRDEGEASRPQSDRDIYATTSGYIPVRIHMELSGSLAAIRPSVTVRGVGENDWADPRDNSEPLLLDGPLDVPPGLLERAQPYSGGNQFSLTHQVTGGPAPALALHGANLAAQSGAGQYNFITHSRGGPSCIMAAWFLYAYGAHDVPVNIFAIDPVPGKGNWYGIMTQLPPNVDNYVGVYAWDHLDIGFNALVPRPNGRMTGQSHAIDLGDTWDTLADKYQLDDPLAPNTQGLEQPVGYELYACRGRHSTVAGNSTADGLYVASNVSDDVRPVPELIYKLARAYLTEWGTTFPEASTVETSALELRRRIHKDPHRFDAMGGGAARRQPQARSPVRPPDLVHQRTDARAHLLPRRRRRGPAVQAGLPGHDCPEGRRLGQVDVLVVPPSQGRA